MTERLDYYRFKRSTTHSSYEGRYWNTNGVGICIVAVVHEDVDWAAYIGADNGWSENECLVWAAERGAKLSAEDAKHFFPDIKLPYRG